MKGKESSDLGRQRTEKKDPARYVPQDRRIFAPPRSYPDWEDKK